MPPELAKTKSAYNAGASRRGVSGSRVMREALENLEPKRRAAWKKP